MYMICYLQSRLLITYSLTEDVHFFLIWEDETNGFSLAIKEL